MLIDCVEKGVEGKKQRGMDVERRDRTMLL